MKKNFFFASFLFFVFSGVIFPSKNENTKLLNYCHSLEKIMVRNSIETKKNVSGRFKKFSKEITKFSVDKTKGGFIKKIIQRYKKNKNSLMINILPNQIYCFSGYWAEKAKPGIFESIIYEQSRKKINEFKDLNNAVDGLLNDFNSEYKNFKREFKNIF